MVRDEKGRFVKGWNGGPGRPPKKREERFLEITMSTVTFSDWEKIIKKAVEQARRGNANARKFLADYLIGPPTQKVEGELNIIGSMDVTDERYREAITIIQQDGDSCTCGREGS